MAIIFQQMLDKAQKEGRLLTRNRESLKWLQNKYTSFQKVRPQVFIAETERKRRAIMTGHMYMFMYDPKGKKELPYYDAFPLVFPFRRVPDGFFGLNMHYLPPVLRMKLMDALYDFQINDKTTQSESLTRLRLSYKILSSAAKYRWFAPCVKHYLTSQLRTPLLIVHPEEWDRALFLPTEQFKKATKEQVWKESMEKLK